MTPRLVTGESSNLGLKALGSGDLENGIPRTRKSGGEEFSGPSGPNCWQKVPNPFLGVPETEGKLLLPLGRRQHH